jgi:hypothetical protein
MSSLGFDEIKNKILALLCCDNVDIDQYDEPPPMGTAYTLDQEAEFPGQNNHIFGTSIPSPPVDVWDSQSARTPFENYYYGDDEIEEDAKVKEGEAEAEEDWGEPSGLPELTHESTEQSYEIHETDNESIDENDLDVDRPHPYWNHDEYGLNKSIRLMKDDVWEGVEQSPDDNEWKRKLFDDDHTRENAGNSIN